MENKILLFIRVFAWSFYRINFFCHIEREANSGKVDGNRKLPSVRKNSISNWGGLSS